MKGERERERERGKAKRCMILYKGKSRTCTSMTNGCSQLCAGRFATVRMCLLGPALQLWTDVQSFTNSLRISSLEEASRTVAKRNGRCSYHLAPCRLFILSRISSQHLCILATKIEQERELNVLSLGKIIQSIKIVVLNLLQTR